MISPRRLFDCLNRATRFTRDRYLPFYYGERRIGWILPALCLELKKYPKTFVVDGETVYLSPELSTFEDRSKAVSEVVRHIGHLPGFGRWNDEYGDIAERWGAASLFHLPRCATKPFGVRSYGSHVNGFVRRGNDLHYWVAQRATNGDYGGMFDTLAGGYIAANTTPVQAANNEIAEEAGLARLSDRALSVGRVRGVGEDAEGVTPYTVFCFDLLLSRDVQPNNHDGEIHSFILMDVAHLVDCLETEKFKFNAIPVVIDWMVRHGCVNPDHPDFPVLIDALAYWDPAV